MERTNIALPAPLHTRVKRRAVAEGKTLQGLAEQLVAFGLAHMDGLGKLKSPKPDNQ